jgi:two-component system chemotaxis response regulator CheY
VAVVKRNLRVGRSVLQCKLTGEGKLILLVDMQNGCAVRTLDADAQTTLDGFKIETPPQKRFDFIVANDLAFARDYADGRIDLYNLASHKKMKSFYTRTFHIEISAFGVSEEGGFFALGDRQGNLTIWSIDKTEPDATINGFDPIALIEFSQNADKIAIAFESGKIGLIDRERTDNGLSLELHNDGVSALRFCGEKLVSGDRNGRLAIWNAQEGKALFVHSLDKRGIKGIERAFDNKTAIVVTSGGALRLVDLNRDQNPLALDTLGEGLEAVSFSDKNELAIVVTQSWNLLFFDLLGDKAIKAFLAQPRESGDESAKIKSAVKAIVVDDSVTMRRVITSALKSDFPELEVFEARNGKEALEILEQNHDARIMFLDWNMPTMSGEEVVAKIKEAKIYPRLKIIMATTEGGQEKVLQMLKMGVAGYLVKPFRREAIGKITGKLMERLSQ